MQTTEPASSQVEMLGQPAQVADPGSIDAIRAYYEARAAEYDDVWLGRGQYAHRKALGWDLEVERLIAAIAEIQPARSIDVGCGTGFLTQYLPGEIVGLDCSATMLEVARHRLPHHRLMRADALSLPFPDRSFHRAFTSFVYGHLQSSAKRRFLIELRRVASEIIVIEGILRSDLHPVRTENRILNNGSRWRVHKEYFTANRLLAELNGGGVITEGHFLAAHWP